MTRTPGEEDRQGWFTTLRHAIWGRWWSALLLMAITMLLIPIVARFY